MSHNVLLFRFTIFLGAAFLAAGCADFGSKFKQLKLQMLKQSSLSEPIATSLDDMPKDAADVAMAVRQQMTGRRPPRNVAFGGDTGDAIQEAWLVKEGFAHTGTLLYTHESASNGASEKNVDGRLDFQNPFGRQASFRYRARYHMTGNGIVVDDASIAPVYSSSPEPLMFVVPMEEFSKIAGPAPRSYGELLQFAGRHSVNPSKPHTVSMEMGDYVIFVFLLDRISSSAKLEVKISEKIEGSEGYKDATEYLDLSGWQVALLPARFILFGDSSSPPLLIKAVFTPGNEVGFFRRTPTRVGQFIVSGRPRASAGRV